MTVKACSKCKVEKPRTAEHFILQKGASDGLHSWCRECYREYGRARPKTISRKRQPAAARNLERIALRERKAASPLAYRSWRHMLIRCNRKTAKDYRRYGARGIKVCDRWLDFDLFLADMGEAPSPEHTLDRFPNGRGNYEPGNCRWATVHEQARNRSSTMWITFSGETLILGEWAKRVGISGPALSWRLAQGWPLDRALTEPRRSRYRDAA